MGKEVFESRGLGGREKLVDKIKELAGLLDDALSEISAPCDGPVADGVQIVGIPRSRECLRLTAMAKTELELSVMLAVKAVSRG